MRILHLADLHLGWEPPFPEPARLAYRTWRDAMLDRLADELSRGKERLDLLLIAGDLFHNHNPDEALLRQTLAAIRRVQDLGVVVVTLPGNHDELTYADAVYRRLERSWPGLLLSNVRWEEPTPLVARGNRVYITGVAYDGREPLSRRKIDRLPPRQSEAPHLALLHGALNAMPSERCFALDGPALLACGYDYIALGHQHRPDEQRGMSGNLLAYAGLPEALGFTEAESAGLCFVDLERGREPRITRVPWLDTGPLRHLDLDCSAFENLFTLHQHLHQYADPSIILRLRLHGALNFALSPQHLYREHSRSFAHLLLDDSDLRPGARLLHHLAEERTIRGSLARECLRETDQGQAFLFSLKALAAQYSRSHYEQGEILR